MFPGKVIGALFPGRLRRTALWQVFYLYSFLKRREFANQNQALMETVLPYQSSRPITNGDRDHVLRWFIHLTGYYQFFTDSIEDGEVLIFDEGFVHRVVQLFSSENENPDFEAVTEYLELIPKPDLVVFTNAPEDICIERVITRGVWDRYRDKDPDDTKRFLANAWTVVNFTVDRLREKNWNLIEVLNDNQDIPNVQERFKQTLSEQFH